MGHRARAVGLAVAALWLAGCGDPLVVTGDSPGVMRIVAGSPEEAGDSLGATAAQSFLNQPHGLAADADGRFYIADRANSRIVRITAAGVPKAVLEHDARTPEPRLHGPSGLALEGSDGLIIADPEGGRVWRLALGSGLAMPIAGTGSDPSTDTTVALQTKLGNPTGVAVAPDGSLYVSERSGHRIRRIDADGGITTIAGAGAPGYGGDGGPALAASLNGPAGLAYIGGVLYIADSENQRVRAIDMSAGTIETVAGSGGAGFAGDGGPALQALLHDPVAVCVTEDRRTLFVAEAANHRIRMVRLDTGIIATFAGDGTDEYSGDLLSAGVTSLSAPRGVT
ncbi:MAG TPA: hypothetical protein VLC48_09790, partial [Gemmatimonadota bacterium]|nr:hypothetical protein [Gemmatimonadota bacterium]